MTPRLSPRQEQVAKLVVRGLSNKAIAEELGLARNTINEYMRRISQRIGGGRPRACIHRWWNERRDAA